MEADIKDTSVPTLPFLKWAGGKRWLVNQYKNILPKKFDRYIEPFLGSGAVFFHLNPEISILNDLNCDLINTYLAIKSDWKKVYSHLKEHHKDHSKDHFYAVRSAKPTNQFTKAARFIYLNRTCWNGLYRVNLKGDFNVPIGTKQKVVFDTDDFETISTRLAKVELTSGDFEQIIDRAGRGDFLFVDPPYTVAHNFNGFIKYNECLFTWEDQIRLRDSIVRAKKRGAKTLLLNAHHESVISLYKGIGKHHALSRASILAADVTKRKSTEELAILC